MMWEVYYRLYEYNDKLTIVCMQDFDERDYNQDKFLVDESNQKYMFESEEDACIWLNTNVKPDLIDERYYNPELNIETFREDSNTLRKKYLL